MNWITQGLSAALLAAGTMFALSTANANIIYSVYGICINNCTLISPNGLVATLTINDGYVADQPLDSSNFVSFTYGGSVPGQTLSVPAFTYSAGDPRNLPLNLSGKLPAHASLPPDGTPVETKLQYPYGFELDFANGCQSLIQSPCPTSALSFTVDGIIGSTEVNWSLADGPRFFGHPLNQGAVSITNVALAVLGTPVPEPATLALFVLGLAGLGFARGRRLN